jgi:hypothetical protein
MFYTKSIFWLVGFGIDLKNKKPVFIQSFINASYFTFSGIYAPGPGLGVLSAGTLNLLLRE